MTSTILPLVVLALVHPHQAVLGDHIAGVNISSIYKEILLSIFFPLIQILKIENHLRMAVC
jgi:hypothetical protein